MGIACSTTVNGKTYEFDFDDQRIDVDATVDSLILGDLWHAIKFAHGCQNGVVYPEIADGEGLATLGTGVATFLTVTLFDNWEVNTLKSSGKFEVGGGNLIRADQADPFRDNPLITYIAFLSQAGIATTVEIAGENVITGDIAEVTALFDEIKGVGWTTETLKAIYDIPAPAGGLTAQEVWEHVGRTLSEGTKDADIDAIKEKTDLLAFTGTDVKATLDGEEVVTDLASREASQAFIVKSV